MPSAAVGSYQFPTTATGQLVSGNTGLTPERATTWNLGFVFNAPQNDGILGDFSFSVDYYNITVKDAVSKDDAAKFKKDLEAAGAQVEVK